MKHLLVPIDFSECAEYALEVAAQLAKRHDATITIFHMIGVSESILSKSELQEQEEAKYYMKLAREKIKMLADKPYLKGINLKLLLQNYKIFEEINLVAEEQKIDLIVMGSHGRSGFSTFFVGSNTEKVVRSSQIPVLVVKKRHPNFTLDIIVFACNLKPENSLAYQKAKAFANTFGAKLYLVYINTMGVNFLSDIEVEARTEQFLGAIGEKLPIKIYNDYSVEDGIFNYAKTLMADLVIIPTHGRKGIAHFFWGSIGEKMANTIKMPLMTLKI
ncbi:universal stress protein [uncultured Croceitalea sp.]|uniref:universal stress protein n=1 Tax=uncultured Croceitalea sp. TaxID=1798908 RepID=UPI0033068821